MSRLSAPGIYKGVVAPEKPSLLFFVFVEEKSQTSESVPMNNPLSMLCIHWGVCRVVELKRAEKEHLKSIVPAPSATGEKLVKSACLEK